jgi:hypothetical protein
MLCVCRDISPISEMRVKIQRVILHVKMTQANEAIDLQGLSDDYWDSTEHGVTVSSESW